MSRSKQRRAARFAAEAEHADRVWERIHEEVHPGVLPPSLHREQQKWVEEYVPLPHGGDEVRRLAATCVFCGELGHRARNCPHRLCFECGQPGHKQRDCPQRSGS